MLPPLRRDRRSPRLPPSLSLSLPLSLLLEPPSESYELLPDELPLLRLLPLLLELELPELPELESLSDPLSLSAMAACCCALISFGAAFKCARRSSVSMPRPTDV